MNKKAQYKSIDGKVMVWIDWILHIQDINDTDWFAAEDDFEKLLLSGKMSEV